ncbi:MAG: 4Fe-4S binding protein [Candidatus Helarchaeota archaeon]|nr:4Fe-4S binding protein [Candidatus Helarchaeota archaeon]
MLCLQFDRCKGCELCIEVCPKNVLEKSTQLNRNVQNPPAVKSGSECSLCRMCEYICPDFSIYVVAMEEA